MSRREGIRRSKSLEDEDYEYAPLNDRPRGYYYSDREEQGRHDRVELVPLREVVRPKATETSSFRRISSTTASREPVRTRGSYRGDEGLNEEVELTEVHRRTPVLNGTEVRPRRHYVGGHDRPRHSAAPELQRLGPRALSDICNKDTISKDNTVGDQAQMDELLATFRKKVFGARSSDQREQYYHTEMVYKCRYCSETFETKQEARRHRTYFRPSDPSRARCKTREEHAEKKSYNSQRSQRQQLAQDEYEYEADADLRDKGPLPIPKEYEDKPNVALDYTQASRSRVAKDTHAKAIKDWEEDNGSFRPEFGAMFVERGDYEFQRPATVRSRERRIPAERLY